MSVRPVAIDPVTAWADDDAWLRKLEIDAERVEQALPTALRHLHRAVLERARSVNARALMLSGSTVRRQRTAISDLDYHLVGPKVETKDLSREPCMPCRRNGSKPSCWPETTLSSGRCGSDASSSTMARFAAPLG